MPSTADSIGAALTTAASTIYTVPAGKVAHILGVTAANVDGVNAVDVSVNWRDASNADASTFLAFNLNVAAQDARACLAGPLALAAGDQLQASASADGDAQLTVTFYLEDAA